MKYAIASVFTNNDNYEYNFNVIKNFYENAIKNKADIIIFPRLALNGLNNELLNSKEYIDKINDVFAEIIDLTKDKTTRILIGNIYYENEKIEDGIRIPAVLNDSAILIDNNCIEEIIKRKNITKNNILDDYKYFDKTLYLQNFDIENKNFSCLIADDIYENNNIFLLKDRKIDNLICLDSSVKHNSDILQRMELIAKFLNCNIIYINSATYYNNYYFDGSIILIDKAKNTTLNTNYKSDRIIYFEIENNKIKCEEKSDLFGNFSILNKVQEIENKKLLINDKYANNDILNKLNNYEIDKIDYSHYFEKFNELSDAEQIFMKKLIIKYYFKNYFYVDNLL